MVVSALMRCDPRIGAGLGLGLGSGSGRAGVGRRGVGSASAAVARGLVALDEGREDLVERQSLLARADDLAAARLDGLDHVGHRRSGVVHDDRQLPRAVLADLPDERQAPEAVAIEQRSRLDLDDVAPDGLASQVVGRREREQRGRPRSARPCRTTRLR